MHNFLGGDTPPAPRSHPLLAFSPKYSALICSRITCAVTQSEAAGSGLGAEQLGTVVSSLPPTRESTPSPPWERPLQWVGSSGLIGPRQKSLWVRGSHGWTRGPRESRDYISQDVARVSFRARSKRPVIEVIPVD